MQKKVPWNAPYEERMDQGYEGGSNEDESNSALNGSCSLASSQGSACSLHRYSSGCCTGGISWADQCLLEDEGDHMLGDEEDVSCVTTEENDGEKPPIPLASLWD